MLHNKSFLVILLISLFTLVTKTSGAQTMVLISEFQAINNETIQDTNGKYSDWIEIYNGTEESVNLLGWSLTDDKENLKKWIFPDIKIASQEYLLVFASGEAMAIPGQELHTSFKLSGSGEYLALVNANNEIASEFEPTYPFQEADKSYGIVNGVYTKLFNPTPNGTNSLGVSIPLVEFSHRRGIYNNSFSLELSSASAAEIYYTTDGSIPSKSTGNLYNTPINISHSTPVSAITVDGNSIGEVVTHTYIFTESVLNQANLIEGYPDNWGKSFLYDKQKVIADYEMDPEICEDATYRSDLIKGLSDIPTFSLVSDIDHFFLEFFDEGEKGGVYIFTGSSAYGSLGRDWEHPGSAEYFDPKTGKTFQVNCGIKLHGGNSRKPDNSPKHSFRLTFRPEYGPTKLNFKLFDEKRDPTNEFNMLVLRAGYNYSWVKNSVEQNTNTDYLRDAFAKRTQLDMGHHSAHNRFVHLYINGIYWGVYDLSEKITNDFMEAYMNGSEEEWDVVEDHNGAIDGDRNSFNDMINLAKSGLRSNSAYMKLQGLNTDGTINPNYQNYLDIDNFIDYMIINFFIGNKDWDGNNWRAARNRINTKHGFRFFLWDSETSMLNLGENITSMVDGDPTTIWNALSANAEFKLKVADHINKLFFNNGALSVNENKARYQELADEIQLAIIAESARWGDYRRDAHAIKGAELYTKNDHWLPEINEQKNKYLEYRSQVVFNQLNNKGFYPSIEAPLFSSYGETIKNSLEFNIENPNSTGEIYYTADGSDPRLMEGAINTKAQLFTHDLTLVGKGKIKARIKNGNTWSALTYAKFKGDTINFIANKNSLALQSAKCYPNPASNYTKFIYNLDHTEKVVINLKSLEGKVITQVLNQTQLAGMKEVYLDTKNLRAGIYLYEIHANKMSTTGKLIIKPY